jgi:hypothetical protein
MLCSARLWSLVFVVSLLSACGGRGGSAVTMPNGSRVAIMLFSDRGVTAETPPEKADQLNQLGEWMESDLIAILKNTGYDATLVQSRDTPTGVGSYLLRVQILEYNGGSKAARMFVGFGAGAARLNTHYELVGPGGSVYLTAAPNASTGRGDWKHAVRKIDQDTVMAVNTRLQKSL